MKWKLHRKLPTHNNSYLDAPNYEQKINVVHRPELANAASVENKRRKIKYALITIMTQPTSLNTLTP